MRTEDFDGVAYRKELGPEFYEEQYENAETIEIVGIACQSFVRYLNPDVTREYPSNQAAVTAKQVHLLNTTLFRRLREGLKVSVLLANPYSKFVQTRIDEEGDENVRRDILSVIESIRCLCDQLTQYVKAEERRITGLLSIRLMDRNPYISIFRATRGEYSTMCLGLLLQGEKGTDSPMLQSWNSGDGRRVWDSISRHFARLSNGGPLLMQWRNADVKFYEYRKPGFDTFFCYNSDDKHAARAIGRDLRRRGCLPWLDQWEIHPGADFVDVLSNVIKATKCATILYGQKGISGRFQPLEVNTFLSYGRDKKRRIIVVILKDVVGEPNLPPLLKIFQTVDFRKSQPDPLEELIGAITASEKR